MRTLCLVVALALAAPAAAQDEPTEAETELVNSISLIAVGSTFIVGAALSASLAVVSGVGGLATVALVPALPQAGLGIIASAAATGLLAALQGAAGAFLLFWGRAMFLGALRKVREPPPKKESLYEERLRLEQDRIKAQEALDAEKRLRERAKERRRQKALKEGWGQDDDDGEEDEAPRRVAPVESDEEPQ